MNSRRILVAAAAIVLAVGVAGVLGSQLLLRGSNVPQLGLDTPSPSAVAAATAATADPSADPGSPDPAASASPAAPGSPASAGDLAGEWTVKEGVAGYRVRETFLQQQADSDAVGRTSGVTGTFAVAGPAGALQLASASVTVDMTTLASDRQQRDGQVRRRGPETSAFPTSTFELAGPVALPARFGSTDVSMTLPGKLTLHGVTKDVQIAAQARLEADGTVVVAGSLPIVFAEYAMEAPNVAGLIAVQDHGSMEFRVVLAKA